ncbi:hypothetical protein E1162_14085 [Rhodobacteraceae bacterium RKSG542]|uniref:hypothetical protein n=1 Tax=Pseudovibrio flavus TaxID=2529854 RepID=UPI0012BC6AC9|nr:hypothetical protein [Pseudovibrio flavus]MTI18369.1 hypothetical protein [Pseudovibrio flavus]
MRVSQASNSGNGGNDYGYRHRRPAQHAGRKTTEDASLKAANTNSKALVVYEATPQDDLYDEQAAPRRLDAYRSYSPIVAHLIAVRDHHPQMRSRCREEPEAALSTYQQTARSTRRMGEGRVLQRQA